VNAAGCGSDAVFGAGRAEDDGRRRPPPRAARVDARHMRGSSNLPRQGDVNGPKYEVSFDEHRDELSQIVLPSSKARRVQSGEVTVDR